MSGEGGQLVDIDVDPEFVMTNPSAPGSTIKVTTSSTGAGLQTLSGAANTTGTRTVYVGGTIPVSNTTPEGALAGTFNVTAVYN